MKQSIKKRPDTLARPPIQLRLGGAATLRWVSAALRLHVSGTAILRVQDGELLELYMLGILSFDDLLVVASDATIEQALLLG